jgi:glutathione S-transferase
MIKIWGRNTSSNVQKAMWAVGELKLEHKRIDIGGAFGKNREPAYLAMNPNGLVPTLEDEDGFHLWESNSPASGWIGNWRSQDLRSARHSGD